MKPEQIAEAFETAATQLGIKVRYEALHTTGVSHGGGLCRVRGQWHLIVEKKTSPAERVSILADTLADFDIEGVFLPPKLRDMVQSRRSLKTAATGPA